MHTVGGRRQASHQCEGIQISIGCGILMGLFYPLVAKAADGPRSLGPYTVVFCFSVGVFLCSLPANTLLMRRPIVAGRTSSFSEYFQGKLAWHFWGVTGGVIWCTGMVFNLVRFKDQHRGSGSFLCYRTRRNHGIRYLGCIYLARVRRCTCSSQKSNSVDVCFFSDRSCHYRNSSSCPNSLEIHF